MKPIATVTILAAGGASAALSEWVSIGSGIATILGAGIALWGLRRRRRRAPHPPAPPAQGASKREWELYAARIDQFYEDQKGSE